MSTSAITFDFEFNLNSLGGRLPCRSIEVGILSESLINEPLEGDRYNHNIMLHITCQTGKRMEAHSWPCANRNSIIYLHFPLSRRVFY